jgi:hypothetical protein
MTQVKIVGKLKHSHGVPLEGNSWPSATILVNFHGYSQTATEQRPSDRAPITTNPDGTWQYYAWRNSDGDYSSFYTFKFPDIDPRDPSPPIKIVVKATTPDTVEFSQLALDSTPPDAPSYPSLIAIINDRLAASGVAFPAGGTVGQTLVVTQETPRLVGWGNVANNAPLKFDQATNSAEWLWNHNLGYRPKPQVYNLAWQEIDAEVVHNSDNQLRVRVNPPGQGYILI